MADIRTLCEQLGSSDQVQEFHARRALTRLAAEAGTPGGDATRDALAAGLAAELVSTTTTLGGRSGKEEIVSPKLSSKSRNSICEYLSLVAGESEVDALRRASSDFEVREMARWCLTRLACQGAADALAEAATRGVGVEYRVGAIAALGARRGSNVVEALKICAEDDDPEVRIAAAEALAEQPDPMLDDVLSAAGNKPRRAIGGQRFGRRMARARLQYAHNLLAAGHDAAAKKVFEAIAGNEETDPAQKRSAQAALATIG